MAKPITAHYTIDTLTSITRTDHERSLHEQTINVHYTVENINAHYTTLKSGYALTRTAALYNLT